MCFRETTPGVPSSLVACLHAQIVYVTVGGELTVTSTAAAPTLSNVRFEVINDTFLVLDVPDLTMTGIYKSVRVGLDRLFLNCQLMSCFPLFFAAEQQ